MSGDNGKAHETRGYCIECPIPVEVHQLRGQVLRVERDTSNTAADLRETADRLQGTIVMLGEQLARFAALAARLDRAIGVAEDAEP